jgi:hypothetical protein
MSGKQKIFKTFWDSLPLTRMQVFKSFHTEPKLAQVLESAVYGEGTRERKTDFQ